MSKYHYISSVAELDKALRSIAVRKDKKKREIKSDFADFKRESTPLNFASSFFKGGMGAVNGTILAIRLFQVGRKVFRRR